ncbi:hypothetical protein LTS18_006823 [Coniosporium uncinatum]|uniref:Uncharacterized protein n=1 Tax=Coniosporium uncinatum TaxID=93489 RepID=A0ACC3D3L1_9PEZI|nr:hypothetical protein LTS18_006823 [Coniosporium uncinatum]
MGFFSYTNGADYARLATHHLRRDADLSNIKLIQVFPPTPVQSLQSISAALELSLALRAAAAADAQPCTATPSPRSFSWPSPAPQPISPADAAPVVDANANANAAGAEDATNAPDTLAAQTFAAEYVAAQRLAADEPLVARQLSGLGVGGLGGAASPFATAAGAGAGGAAGAAGCTPNAFERFNLGHHHDINTGDIIIGSTVRKSAAKVPGGSGCSPVWAGGSYNDAATFPGGQYPAWLAAQAGGA